MTWHDDGDDLRGHARRMGRPGGDWQGLRPSWDNPATWALPLGRWMGIAIRMHVLFVVLIGIMLAKHAFTASWASVGIVAAVYGSLAVLVLLHELGHCFACRAAGGHADEILMWPLGGLAFCRPPNHWRAHLATVLGGPVVNMVIWVVVGPMLGALTGAWWGVAVPNVLDAPQSMFARAVVGEEGLQPWWLLGLAIVNHVNMILLLFNAIPMFPLDGGRVAQTLLWSRLGYARATRIAVRTGYAAAIVLGIFGLVQEQIMILVVAVFGGLVCWQTSKQLEFTEEVMGFETGDHALELLYEEQEEPEPAVETVPSPRQRRRQERAEQRRLATAEEIDGILDKISRTGLDSLTPRERRLLQQETARKRQQQG